MANKISENRPLLGVWITNFWRISHEKLPWEYIQKLGLIELNDLAQIFGPRYKL